MRNDQNEVEVKPSGELRQHVPGCILFGGGPQVTIPCLIFVTYPHEKSLMALSKILSKMTIIFRHVKFHIGIFI